VVATGAASLDTDIEATTAIEEAVVDSAETTADDIAVVGAAATSDEILAAVLKADNTDRAGVSVELGTATVTTLLEIVKVATVLLLLAEEEDSEVGFTDVLNVLAGSLVVDTEAAELVRGE